MYPMQCTDAGTHRRSINAPDIDAGSKILYKNKSGIKIVESAKHVGLNRLNRGVFGQVNRCACWACTLWRLKWDFHNTPRQVRQVVGEEMSPGCPAAPRVIS